MRFDKTMLRRFVLVLALVGFALGTVACHTTEGFGKDVESAGEAIQDGAD